MSTLDAIILWFATAVAVATVLHIFSPMQPNKAYADAQLGGCILAGCAVAVIVVILT